MNEHARLVEEGWLGGGLSPRHRADWPEWARRHFEACAACQRLGRVDAALLGLARARSGNDDEPPALDLARVLARSQRPAPSRAVALAAHFPAMDGAYRDVPLTLSLDAGGVRAEDSAAVQVSVFRVDDAGEVFHLATSTRDGGLARASVPLAAPSATDVVALGLGVEVEPTLLEVWLRDLVGAYGRGWIEQLPRERVHARQLRVAAAQPTLPLRIREADYPPGQPEVEAAVEAAAQAGREGRERDAVELFSRARQLAEARGDEGSAVRSTLGLASALLGLGYHDDAGAVLDELVARAPLSPARASQAARAQSIRALLAGDAERTEAWLAAARALDPLSTSHLPIQWYHATWQLDPEAVARAVEADRSAPGSDRAYLREVMRALALAQAGPRVAATAALPPEAPTRPLEVRLWHAVAAWTACDNDEAARATVAALRGLLAGLDGPGLSAWDARPLAFLAGLAVARHPALAAELLRWRFLDAASFPGVPALVLAVTPAGVLRAGPGSSARALAASPAEVRAAVRAARDAAMGEGDVVSAAGGLLAVLELQAAELPPHLVVASDGLLDGAPWALFGPLLGGGPLAVTEALGRGAAYLRRPDVAEVLSIADAEGDLPLSARDLEELPGALRREGPAATWAALREAPALGLVHLGLHVARDSGLPRLRFADAAVGPVEIAAHRLRGQPVVLLAGCASAPAPRAWGVEHSLAEAFLASGASAVVGTRWALRDDEAHALFRALAAVDPISRLESGVAQASERLRIMGLPPRVWAAAAVFRR